MLGRGDFSVSEWVVWGVIFGVIDRCIDLGLFGYRC